MLLLGLELGGDHAAELAAQPRRPDQRRLRQRRGRLQVAAAAVPARLAEAAVGPGPSPGPPPPGAGRATPPKISFENRSGSARAGPEAARATTAAKPQAPLLPLREKVAAKRPDEGSLRYPEMCDRARQPDGAVRPLSPRLRRDPLPQGDRESSPHPLMSPGALQLARAPRFGRRQAQAQGEDGALAGQPVAVERAAHQFGQAARDVQPQARAAVAAGRGVVVLLEALEQALADRGGRSRRRCRAPGRRRRRRRPSPSGGSTRRR